MWWDERQPGGKIRSLIFMGHPGPSVLVTVVLVAIAGLAGRGVPDGVRILQLVGAMLPVQLCIGVVNDVVDLPADAVAKPHKPLVCGVVSRSTAAVIGIVLGAIGLGAAATINLPTLGLDALALAAGLSYDLGLRRTPLSWVPWWAGMAVLPLEGYASVGSIPSRLLALIPLSGLIALGLHFANALPDIAGDRNTGRRSLPVLAGHNGSRRAGPLSLAVAGVLALLLAGPLGQVGPVFFAGVAVLAVGVIAVVVTRSRTPFPALALATAIFAVAWLASLPRG
jgi:4-hydroxybenzoate polyprenyltransferase